LPPLLSFPLPLIEGEGGLSGFPGKSQIFLGALRGWRYPIPKIKNEKQHLRLNNTPKNVDLL
jgi:hypothetical protein